MIRADSNMEGDISVRRNEAIRVFKVVVEWMGATEHILLGCHLLNELEGLVHGCHLLMLGVNDLVHHGVFCLPQNDVEVECSYGLLVVKDCHNLVHEHVGLVTCG